MSMTDDGGKVAPVRVKPILKDDIRDEIKDKIKDKIEDEVDEAQEDAGYRLVITVEERYDTLERAETAYKRFVGGHGINRVAMVYKGKTLEQGVWGSIIDEKGYHTIDGTQASIKFIDAHL